MFTLRNVAFTPTTDPQMLKQAMFDELGSELLSRKLDFAIGYFKKSQKLWFNNEEDIHDAYEILLHNRKLTFWCLPKKPERYVYGSSNDEDDDGEDPRRRKRSTGRSSRSSTREERTTRVNDFKTQLREKHGSQYNGVQYALWAETIVAGTHESLENPPPAPLFGAQRPRGHSSTSTVNLTEVLSVAADKFATALAQPRNSAASAPSSSYSSPSKTAELRGMYIKQLKDIVELRDIGALTGEEYEQQRSMTVNLMERLQPTSTHMQS